MISSCDGFNREGVPPPKNMVSTFGLCIREMLSCNCISLQRALTKLSIGLSSVIE
jgi:hypothetical protein